jgi:hypothetical protein
MKLKPEESPKELKVSEKPSPVKAVISWLVETDREFRVAQSMVEDSHDKI